MKKHLYSFTVLKIVWRLNPLLRQQLNPLEVLQPRQRSVRLAVTEQSRPVEKQAQPTSLQKMVARLKSFTKGRKSTQREPSPVPPKQVPVADEVVTSKDYSEIAAILEKVSKQPQFAEKVKHSFKAFLKMEDTGGQPELMDILPALTIGPGLYLLLFSYKYKLNEECQVYYQRATGETTAPKKSEFTLQEMLLRTLASSYILFQFLHPSSTSQTAI